MNCQKCNRSFSNFGAMKSHKCITPEQIKEVNKLYDSGLSLQEIRKLGYGRYITRYAIKDRRSLSEATKLGRKKYPFKHTNESKQKLSISTSKWLKTKVNHPWRNKQESYPEKLLREWLVNNSGGHQIIQEYTPEDFDKNYRMDFAVINLKIDIEINGNVHYLNKETKELKPYYLERECYIRSKGWSVLNIFAKDLCKQFDDVVFQLSQILNGEKIENAIKTQKEVISAVLDENFEKIKQWIFEGYNTKYICEAIGVSNKQLRKFLRTKNIKRQSSLNYKAQIKTFEIMKDLANYDLDKWGVCSELAKKWKTNTTRMSRHIRNYKAQFGFFK